MNLYYKRRREKSENIKLSIKFPLLPPDGGGDPLQDALLVLVGLDDEIGGQGGFDRGDGEAPDPDIEERGAAGSRATPAGCSSPEFSSDWPGLRWVERRGLH